MRRQKKTMEHVEMPNHIISVTQHVRQLLRRRSESALWCCRMLLARNERALLLLQ